MDWTTDDEEKDDFDWGSDDGSEPVKKEPSPVAGVGPSRQVSEAGPSCFIGTGSGDIVVKSEEDEGGFYWVSDEAVEAEKKETIACRSDFARTSEKACEAGPSCSKLVSHFVGMGFSVDMVKKAIKQNGEEDADAILETLLTITAVEKSPDCERTPVDCSLASDKDASEDGFSDFGDFEIENFSADSFERDRTVSTLVEMGFLAEEASAAIDRCGPNATVLELADSIRAAQMAEESDDEFWKPSIQYEPARSFKFYKHKKMRYEADLKGKRSRYYEQKNFMRKVAEDDDDNVPSLIIPKPMVGFGLPFERPRVTHRNLHDVALGPPYFYYENVALAPKGVWETISRYLYDIEPEFVDSKYFCAAARKRGYIHNLPINKRFPLLPTPAKTIHEAFPMTRKWWPAWDDRKQLNCLQTCVASAKLTERIRTALVDADDPPPLKVQQYVLNECKKWNLLWVGLHKLAPLEPDEIEELLGFPRNHTRGGGISRTERYKSLGNSFQVDTVAYHLSVLKDMFPNGITVLSLFSGIGGAEVALYRLGIHLKAVVSVEISEVNRNIVRSWWEQTNQTGTLIHIDDIQKVNGDRLAHYISRFGGFDLVVGGSPCNNLAGSNRHTRTGLTGEHSSLFHDYCRILELVKDLMKKF